LEKKDLVTVDGAVETIVYANEENGYTVCHIDADGELVSAVGYMPYLSEGETVSVRGSWEVHPNFGKQLRVEFYEKKLPSGIKAIHKYLASGAIRGIGPVTAERIVEKFGEQAFDIIEKKPEWLCDIKGVTAKRAQQIHDCYAEQFGMRSVMAFCMTYFGPSLSVRIYKQYGPSAVDVIKLNPYALAETVNGISFPKADKVAKDLGFEPTCSERTEAGLKYALSLAMYRDGHCYLPRAELAQSSASLLGTDPECADNAIDRMINSGMLVAQAEHDAIYDPDMIQDESYISQKLRLLESTPRLNKIENIDSHIATLEKEFGCSYAPEQKKAITCAVTNGVTIVTGGPGTGKTTVIKAIIDIFTSLGISFLLCAPTGRAAKRMSETSGHEAKTIHRMLEIDYSGELHEPKFKRNEENPLPCSALIVDEVSMVDTPLMAAMLRAVKPGAYLILIGDSDQLPSVGPGNVLHDVIGSERFDVVCLTHIFRQASESLIITNAHAINRGEMPELDNRRSDFFFLDTSDYQSSVELICELCLRRLPKTYGADPYNDIQVITPTRKGMLGTVGLNKALQAALNPQNGRKAEKRIGDAVFRVNDKVMQIRNNYDIVWERDGTQNTGIFNGDIGTIRAIDHKDELITVDFDGRIANYDFSLAEELEHAYAVTVHKSQGSEYPIVLLVLLGSSPLLRTRNLLYTAVTRAQKLVIACGSRAVVADMVANNRRTKRYTLLKERLR